VRIGALAPGVEVEQLLEDRHPRERNLSQDVNEGGSVDPNGARRSAPPHLGCLTAPITFRAAKAAEDGDGTGEGPLDPSNHGGSPFPTPEGYLDCYSHRDLRTQCSGWPS
jgi:hypothetical protein